MLAYLALTAAEAQTRLLRGIPPVDGPMGRGVYAWATLVSVRAAQAEDPERLTTVVVLRSEDWRAVPKGALDAVWVDCHALPQGTTWWPQAGVLHGIVPLPGDPDYRAPRA